MMPSLSCWRNSNATNNQDGPGTIRCRARRFRCYTQVSSHMRPRQESIGRVPPV